ALKPGLEREGARGTLKDLPADVALVDFVIWQPPVPVKTGESRPRRLWATVLRRDRFHRVNLGPLEPIEKVMADWLATLPTRTVPVAGKDDPAVRLRRLVWEPLETHLAGAPIVLVTSDGPLCRLPWAALPGSDPKKYLLEERLPPVVCDVPILGSRPEPPRKDP